MTERFGIEKTRQKRDPNIWVKLSILRNRFSGARKLADAVDFGSFENGVQEDISASG
jgi:hypothetical protein